MLVEELKEARQRLLKEFMPHVQTRLQEFAKQYNISLLFVGLFGSQAKGYAGPESDYDFYVVYHGPLSQYVKVIDFDTRQFKNENTLPPQITLDIPYVGLKKHPAVFRAGERIELEQSYTRVQLNFVSFDAYVQELGRSNLDFRIALDNIQLSADKSLENLVRNFAMISYDPEKYKHTGYGRALRAADLIWQLEQGEGDKVIRRSEVTDCLYRLLMSWAATSVRMIPWLALNRTITLNQLIDQYLEIMGDDPEIRELRQIVPLIASDGWPEAFNKYAGSIVNVVTRLVPVIKTRPVAVAPTYLIDKSPAAKLNLINKVNEAFVELLLKGGK